MLEIGNIYKALRPFGLSKTNKLLFGGQTMSRNEIFTVLEETDPLHQNMKQFKILKNNEIMFLTYGIDSDMDKYISSFIEEII